MGDGTQDYGVTAAVLMDELIIRAGNSTRGATNGESPSWFCDWGRATSDSKLKSDSLEGTMTLNGKGKQGTFSDVVKDGEGVQGLIAANLHLAGIRGASSCKRKERGAQGLQMPPRQRGCATSLG